MSSTMESPAGIDTKKTILESSPSPPEMLQHGALFQNMQPENAQTVSPPLGFCEDADVPWHCNDCPISHSDETHYTDGDQLNTFDPLADIWAPILYDSDSLYEEKSSPSDHISTPCQVYDKEHVLEENTPKTFTIPKGDACYDIGLIQKDKCDRNPREIANGMGIDPAVLHFN
ncbi:uncharacterized protein FFNC_15638 [Fusarium fujikuroi]|nr:uncharacterized protein FFNC_15638 [Fusarium fujikuroi]